MLRAKSVAKFQFHAVVAPQVVRIKKRSNGNYEPILAVKFLAF